MSYFNGHKIPNITSRGASAFIRYSAHSDGKYFTETWSEGQIYIGFATGQKAPTEKEAYTWFLFNGTTSDGGESGNNLFPISGVWTFNEIVTVGNSAEYGVNFSSNGTAYKEIKTNFKGYFYYIDVDGGYNSAYSSSAWKDEAYRTVDFGTTPQAVTVEFYNWLATNAVPQTQSNDNGYVSTEAKYNLVNPDALQDGFVYSDGNVIENASYITTDFIPVKAGEKIAVLGLVKKFLAYDTAKTPIIDTYNGSDQENLIYTPTVDGYVRMSFMISHIDTVCVAYSDSTPEYEAYKKVIQRDVYLNEKQINEQILPLIKNDNAAKTEIGKNKLDFTKAIEGYYFDANGNLLASEWFITSDFIPVKAGQNVAITGTIRHLLAYDIDKNAIVDSYSGGSGAQTDKIFTPTVDGFIRVSVPTAQKDKVMIAYNDVCEPYEPVRKVIERDVYLNEIQIKEQILPLIQPDDTDEGGFIKSENGKNKFDLTKAVSGYIVDASGYVGANEWYVTSEFIPVAVGQSVAITGTINRFLAYDESKNPIADTFDNSAQTDKVYAPTVDGFIRISAQTAFMNSVMIAYSDTCEVYEPVRRVLEKDVYLNEKQIEEQVLPTTGNVLYGKKWVACGDSFTQGDFTNAPADTENKFTDNPYIGKNKVYPFFIGRRNSMVIVNEAVSGSTIAKSGAGAGYFSAENGRYMQIPTDADYITLWFGINDEHHSIPIGTIDDTTNETFYGAWNVVMDYLLNNHPNAKIGIVITNGCLNTEYPIAIREIAQKWGVGYLDLNGDYKIPLMLRVSEKPKIPSSVHLKIAQKQSVLYGTNGHPNAEAHEYQSTFIEAWLRTL